MARARDAYESEVEGGEVSEDQSEVSLPEYDLDSSDHDLVDDDKAADEVEEEPHPKKPPKPYCPISFELLTSTAKLLGTLDGRIYDADSIKEWVSKHPTSPTNPNLRLTDKMLFNPVGVKEVLEYAEYKAERCKKLKKDNKALHLAVDHLTKELEHQKAQNRKLTSDFTHFKANVKRKVDEFVGDIKTLDPSRAKKARLR